MKKTGLLIVGLILSSISAFPEILCDWDFSGVADGTPLKDVADLKNGIQFKGRIASGMNVKNGMLQAASPGTALNQEGNNSYAELPTPLKTGRYRITAEFNAVPVDAASLLMLALAPENSVKNNIGGVLLNRAPTGIFFIQPVPGNQGNVGQISPARLPLKDKLVVISEVNLDNHTTTISYQLGASGQIRRLFSAAEKTPATHLRIGTAVSGGEFQISRIFVERVDEK